MVSRDDHARIAAAVRKAETRTRAELVCVLARTSAPHDLMPLAFAALLALAAPAPMLALTAWSAGTVFALQLVAFLVVLGVLWHPAVRLRLVPRAMLRKRAHRAAAEQFRLRGLHRKRDRTGVLIFASEAERYARIIADEGVATLVPPERWNDAIATLRAHARSGQVAEGYIAAVALCGDVLAEHLPPQGDPTNELSDSFHVV